MKIASAAFGVIGGLVSIAAAAEFLWAASANSYTTMTVEAVFALLLGLTALASAALVPRNPRLAAWLMLAVFVGGFLVGASAASVMGPMQLSFAAVAAPLLLAGAVLGFLASRSTPRSFEQAPQP